VDFKYIGPQYPGGFAGHTLSVCGYIAAENLGLHWFAGQKKLNGGIQAEISIDYLKEPGIDTYRQAAEHFGISKVVVSYHLAVLNRLPADFVAWLEAYTEDLPMAFFSLRRLRPVTMLQEPERKGALLPTSIRNLTTVRHHDDRAESLGEDRNPQSVESSLSSRS